MSQKKRDKNKTDQSLAPEDKIRKNENDQTGGKARQASDKRDAVAATGQSGPGAGSGKDKKAERKPEVATSAKAAHAAGTNKPSETVAKSTGDKTPEAKSSAAQSTQDKKPDKQASPESRSQAKPQPQGASASGQKNATGSTSGSAAASTGSQSAGQHGKNGNVAKRADSSPSRDSAASRDKAVSTKQATATGSTTSAKPAPAKPAAATSSTTSTSGSSGANGPRPPATGKTGDGGGQEGGKGSGLIATVALILAIVALAVSGYLWYQGQQQVAALGSRIDTAKSDVQSQVDQKISPKLSDMSDHVRDIEGKLDQLGKTDNAQQQKIVTLQQHVQRVAGKYHQLSDQLGGNHQRFVEQRIALLLEAANQRLQVNHDPQSAMRALVLADQSIQRVGDPALGPVRKAIANEYYQLKALPNPDIQGLSLKLDKLIQQVPKLPLANDVPSSYEPKSSGGNGEADAADSDENTESGTSELAKKWHALVGSVTSVVSSAVTIQHTNGDKSKPVLLPPQKSYYLTQNLQLELRTARLALLEGKPKVYQNAVTQAADWIKQYFDTSDKQVKVVLDELDQLSQAKLAWTAPNISGSLDALHQVMSQRQETDNQVGGGQGQAGSPDTDSSDQSGQGQQGDRQPKTQAPEKPSGSDDDTDHGEDS